MSKATSEACSTQDETSSENLKQIARTSDPGCGLCVREIVLVEVWCVCVRVGVCVPLVSFSARVFVCSICLSCLFCCARLLLWFSCLRSFFVDSHSLICVTVVSEEIMAVNLTGDSDEVRG